MELESQYASPNADKFSKINSAALINLRIHNLWLEINNFASKGWFASWNSKLDRMWCELAGDVDEGSDKWKEYEKIQKDVSSMSPLKNWENGIGFLDLDEAEEKKQLKQYDLLIKKEVFLRKLMNYQGKGTAYLDPADEYLTA